MICRLPWSACAWARNWSGPEMISAVNYRRMSSVFETCEALVALGGGARILAGGTDVLIGLRGALGEDERTLLDIGRIPDIDRIEEKDGRLVIGARATFADIAGSSPVRRFASVLAEAAAVMGNPQIRNRATLGGNICNGSPCADSVPALTVLDAKLRFVSVSGERVLSVEETICGPYSTTPGPEWFLTEVELPFLPDGARTGYARLARRRAAAKARMAVAVVLTEGDDGSLADVRIGCGSVTPRPHRMRKAEGVLRGRVPTEALVLSAAAAVSAEMIEETGVRWSTEYKDPVVAALAARALGGALGWSEDGGIESR